MKKKHFAIMLTLVAILFFVFSIFCIVNKANHECKGKECVVCKQIAAYKEAIEELGTGIITAIAVAVVVFGGVYKFVYTEENNVKKNNLVSLKVEMLN